MFDSYLADDDPVRGPVKHRSPTVDQIDSAMRPWHAGRSTHGRTRWGSAVWPTVG